MQEGGVVEQVLTLGVGDTYVAVPVSSVIETMRLLPIASLRDAPVFVRGLSVVRGRPVPVVDAATLLGDAGARVPRRFVTLRASGRVLALAVDRVVGLRRLRPHELEELPSLVGRAPSIQAIGVMDEALLLVLASARILPEGFWASLAADGGERPS